MDRAVRAVRRFNLSCAAGSAGTQTGRGATPSRSGGRIGRGPSSRTPVCVVQGGGLARPRRAWTSSPPSWRARRPARPRRCCRTVFSAARASRRRCRHPPSDRPKSLEGSARHENPMAAGAAPARRAVTASWSVAMGPFGGWAAVGGPTLSVGARGLAGRASSSGRRGRVPGRVRRPFSSPQSQPVGSLESGPQGSWRAGAEQRRQWLGPFVRRRRGCGRERPPRPGRCGRRGRAAPARRRRCGRRRGRGPGRRAPPPPRRRG